MKELKKFAHVHNAYILSILKPKFYLARCSRFADFQAGQVSVWHHIEVTIHVVKARHLF